MWADDQDDFRGSDCETQDSRSRSSSPNRQPLPNCVSSPRDGIAVPSEPWLQATVSASDDMQGAGGDGLGQRSVNDQASGIKSRGCRASAGGRERHTVVARGWTLRDRWKAERESSRSQASIRSYSHELLEEVVRAHSCREAEKASSFPVTQLRRLMSPFVIMPDSKKRHAWNSLVGLLLLYIGTIFPYRLCFVEFRADQKSDFDEDEGWRVVNIVVDVFFWMDLVLNFFFAYVDHKGCTIDDPIAISSLYLRSWFLLDFLACLDPEVFAFIFGLDEDASHNPANKAVRLARIYRMGRLSRLVRLLRLSRLFRLVKVVRLMHSSPVFWAVAKAFGQSRFAAVLKFLTMLMFLVHLLACGWYLVASVGVPKIEQTWIYRRGVQQDGPFDQWVTSVYFVLTIFTSVGLGDIYAEHVLEMMFCMMLQLLGAVVQSIIVSEMISALTRVDEAATDLKSRCALVRNFGRQTQLGLDVVKRMEVCVESNVRKRAEIRYDRHAMQDLINFSLPRELKKILPAKVFNGSLRLNRLFTMHRESRQQDARLILMASVHISSLRLNALEIVYNQGDSAGFIFLVCKGIVSHLAMATATGGKLNMIFSATSTSSHERIMRAQCRSPTRRTSREPIDKDNDFGRPNPRFELSPFSLSVANSYFGEWEIVIPGQRWATARAEVDTELMTLPRHAFVLLCGEFPEFQNHVKEQSLITHRRMERQLASLKEPGDFLTLAVGKIQGAVRKRFALLRDPTGNDPAAALLWQARVPQLVSSADSPPDVLLDQGTAAAEPPLAEPPPAVSPLPPVVPSPPPFEVSPSPPVIPSPPLHVGAPIVTNTSPNEADADKNIAAKQQSPSNVDGAGSEQEQMINTTDSEGSSLRNRGELRVQFNELQRHTPSTSGHSRMLGEDKASIGAVGGENMFASEAACVRKQLDDLRMLQKRQMQQHAEVLENQQEMTRILTELHFRLVHDRRH